MNNTAIKLKQEIATTTRNMVNLAKRLEAERNILTAQVSKLEVSYPDEFTNDFKEAVAENLMEMAAALEPIAKKVF
jgi:hypothetical protein